MDKDGKQDDEKEVAGYSSEVVSLTGFHFPSCRTSRNAPKTQPCW
jgi:hypothetical protein